MLKALHEYLILHLLRFKRNGFYNDNNTTIVVFPIKNLILGGYVHASESSSALSTEEEVDFMTLPQLEFLLAAHCVSHLSPSHCPREKTALDTVLKDFVTTFLPNRLS